jgi:hypothetical protein
MKSSSYFHAQNWAAAHNTAHSSFTDVHQHLDDNSHLFDEMIQSSQLAAGQKEPSHPQPKAKVLFQFFDGWPMAAS